MEFVLRSPVQGIPHPIYGRGSRDDNKIYLSLWIGLSF